MAKFTILHHSNGEYNQVAVIDANDLNDAFKRSQNDFNKDYASLGVRSTMVGDMIIDENDSSFVIKGMGFKRVSVRVLRDKPLASI